MSSDATAIDALRDAFQRHDLSLHLGAGVSAASNLPTWEKLVLSMYFSLTSGQRMRGWRPYPNYLYAIAEWYLEQQREPLEITARKLQKYFSSDGLFDNSRFVDSLHDNLYAPYLQHASIPLQAITENQTLNAVAELIRQGDGSSGVRSVVSYNYDDLLERALGNVPHQAVYQEEKLASGRLPIYHVHGYVPFKEQAVAYQQDLVFTEDQYHRIGRDPYHWSNIVQLRSISGSATLMLGLSLADRNMRRLLDAIATAPMRTFNFAILQRPTFNPPEPQQLDDIHRAALDYRERFEKSGAKREGGSEEVLSEVPGEKSIALVELAPGGKKEPRYRYQISGIMNAVHELEEDLHAFVLDRLGVTPIWITDFSEIPEILAKVSS